MSWRTAVGAGTVLAAASAVVVGASIVQAGAAPVTAGADAQVAHEVLSNYSAGCPVAITAAEIDVVATNVPDLPGQDRPGMLSVLPVGVAGPPERVSRSGSSAVLSGLGADAAAQLRARAGLAPGSVGAIVVRDGDGDGKGIASSRCAPVGAESWLVGAGAGDGQRDTLQLVNPTATDSVVDLGAYASSGPVELTGNEGIVVPANDLVTVHLDALAPGIPQTALRVRTRVGLVAAWVFGSRMDGLTPRGVDYLTPAGEPSTDLVIPGIPAGAGERRVNLLAPSGRGTVRLSLAGAEGERRLFADEELTLKRGRVRVLDLAPLLDEQPGGLRIEADVPVVASLQVATVPSEAILRARRAGVAAAEKALLEARGVADREAAAAELAEAEQANEVPPGSDLMWLTPAPSIPSLAAVTGLEPDLTTTVSLTASDSEATVELQSIAVLSSGAPRTKIDTITVPPLSTRTFEVPAQRARFGLVAQVRQGSVRVAHAQGGPDGLLTGYTWHPLPIRSELPTAQPDYAGG